MSDPDDVFGQATVLRTARLTLRQVTEADGPGLFDIFGDDRVTEHYAWDTFTTIAEADALAARTASQFRQREAMRWGLVPHGIGDLAAAYWRRGLMSEAVAAVLTFGFDRMALNRVEATVHTANTASIGLLTRMGFTREGELRERVLHRGTFHDVYMFGITRADWLTGSTTVLSTTVLSTTTDCDVDVGGGGRRPRARLDRMS